MSKPRARTIPTHEIDAAREAANAAIKAFRQLLLTDRETTGETKHLVMFGRECLMLGASTLSRCVGPVEAAEAAYRIADEFVARSNKEGQQ